MNPSLSELPLFAAPVAADDEVGRFEALLLEARGWRTAEEVLGTLGIVATETNKRRVRAWANRTARVISGQRGYRHLRHASADEVRHCCAALEHQVKEVAERVARIRREFHGTVG